MGAYGWAKGAQLGGARRARAYIGAGCLPLLSSEINATNRSENRRLSGGHVIPIANRPARAPCVSHSLGTKISCS